ncbi:MAG: fasciclin domain-containing protein [Phycisphaerales bacterium]|nr:fasciclin domain-containing protein [Hyphomonadaceae bacterium]
MKNIVTATAASLAFVLAGCGNAEQSTSETGDTTYAAGAEQPAPATTIVDAAAANPDFSTLVTAVQAAGLAETLSGAGPFTVFAPTNAAFGKLPAGTVESLTQPAQRDALRGILTYHVVSGRVGAADLISQIQAGGGTATLTTVQGATLTARQSGSSVVLTDAAGGTSTVTTTDLNQSNGVIHVIDTVLMPS